MSPKFVRGRSEGVPGAFAKMLQKTTPKTKPKGSQLGVQMGANIEPKMSPKTRSLPGGTLGRSSIDFGTICDGLRSEIERHFELLHMCLNRHLTNPETHKYKNRHRNRRLNLREVSL